MEKVYVCSSFRTLIGAFCGQYNSESATKLGSCVLFHCLDHVKVGPEEISEVIMGQVFVAGQGQNPARQAAVLAKIPPHVPAFTINMACGSGLRAVYSAYNSIKVNENSLVLAGGQESISNSEHLMYMRSNIRFGNLGVKDSAISDGLTCAFLEKPLGAIADSMATALVVPREIQDKYALMSQIRAAKAADSGYFADAIVPTNEHAAFAEIHIDEFIRRDVSLEALADMKPLYGNEGCSVTSANSASFGDGAAAVLLASSAEVKQKDLSPEVLIVAMVQVGCEPVQVGLAVIAAVKKVLEKAKWSMDEVDLFEIDEANAVQTMLCVNILDIDLAKVNVSGGAIALGNPLGAGGARLLVTLIHNMKRLEMCKGVAAMSIGGGLAIAMAIQRCEGRGEKSRLVQQKKCKSPTQRPG